MVDVTALRIEPGLPGELNSKPCDSCEQLFQRLCLQEEVLLEVLGLANQYGFVELQSAMSEYLKAVLHIRNVCLIFDIASMYGLRSLCETCCQFMDHNAAEILLSEGFLSLSPVARSVSASLWSTLVVFLELERSTKIWTRLVQ